ncbi:MAG TPA: ATP-binding protein [Gemmatimonadales bacterium]|nr:ATP-binding protein [Gemmatimonadales bacterium]
MSARRRKPRAQPERPHPGGAPDRARAEQIQRATYRISEAAHAAPTVQELFRAIHGIVGELMPADNFYIALYDAAHDTISFPYFVDQYDPPQPPKRAGRGLTEYVLRTGRSLLADEALHRELEHRGEADLIGAPSVQWLGVPLKMDATTIGVLAVQTYTAGVRYGEPEQRVLEFVSTQIAMVVERKRAEETLREQRRFLRQVIDANPSLIFVKDWDGKFTLVNQALADLYGGTVDGLIGKGDADFNRNREEVEHFLRDDRWVMSSAHPKFIPEETVTDATGNVRWFQTVKVPLVATSGGARQVLGVATEITHRKQLETQLAQAHKMEAVGRLAGGVAHDFNNLLTAMLGATDLLLQQLGPEHPGRDDADAVRQAALRAAELTRHLLAFSRQQVLAPRALDLNALISDIERMLRRLIGEHIELRTALAPGLGVVRADPGQLEQVVMNLAVNARDAMPRGGRLLIETANVELDAGARPQVPVIPGPYVMLAVTDTGSGMDAATQVRIFEPFFTTKEMGKGTGLGLATVYGIVKQSGGYIWVDSEPGQGATFRIYLPRVEAAVEPAVPAPQPSASFEGTETVLLVEDQADVRRATQKVLEGRGYRVLVAGDGAEALRVSEQHGGPIHLLLADVVMPGMSGRDVGLALAPARPEMKALYVSGYANASIIADGALEPGLAFLQKPFTADALARKVREVLEAPAPDPRG